MSEASELSYGPEDVRRVLRNTFGFPALRPGQEDTIGDVLAGRPVIAVMPTGAGKSLCYQLPAVLLAENEGTSIVVSPLIALMKDQVDGLRERGIATAALTSAATTAEQSEILQGIRAGTYDIVYVAPERFHSSRFMDALREMQGQLALMAIDEAHCISEWGHEFRPAYRLLGEAIRKLAPRRLLAVTATATPEVRVDIARQLGIEEPAMHVRGFARPELCFSVEHSGGAKDKGKRIVEMVSAVSEGASLVYAATRKNAEAYAAQLQGAGLRACAYHAGLEDRHRSAVQDEFMSGDVDVIVATNAFGMGVDKTDVRLVVHADLPRSLEAYYQEAGRAGRDTLDASCVLLFNHGDVRLQEFLIDASYPSAALLRSLWRTLRERPGMDMADLKELDLPGSPHESTLSTAVRILGRHGYLSDEGGHLCAVQPAEISGDFPAFDPEATERRSVVERDKLRRMVDYSYHSACRHSFVLDYFGEERSIETEPCDNCDNCQGVGQAQALSDHELEQAELLLALVGELGGRFGRKRIAGIANGSDDDERFYGLQRRGCLSGTSQKAILDLLRSLEAAKLVEQSRGDYPTIQLSRHGKKVAGGRAELDPELLRLIPSSTSKSKSRRSRAVDLASDADPAAVERLRQLRTQLARERSVPAYVIFSNRTLEELSAIRPSTLEELGSVHGIGASRIDKFGEDILAALAEL